MNHPDAGYCGDYCGKCDNYLGDCMGCVPEQHAECHFIHCCAAKGIEHCGFCDELPCDILRTFIPDDRPGCPPGYHIENLKRRRQLGTEMWLEEQRRLWGA